VDADTTEGSIDMRVLLAGGTGAIGRRLAPLLTASGHDVIVMARHAPDTTEAAVRYIAADALDPTTVHDAFEATRPDAVVNLLTAIPDPIDAKRMATQFRRTDELRTTGTRHLIEAASRAGTKTLICESIAFGYEPAPGLAGEDSPLMATPPRQFATALAAVKELERATTEAGGRTLRLGQLFGPGTTFGTNGGFRAMVQRRKVPVVGGGGAVFSFLHIDDAATAILAALTGPAGTYNIVDDDPAAVHEWLPAYAAALGAPTPSRAPKILARLAVGSWGVTYMTALRGAGNAKAAADLHWTPTHQWRDELAVDDTADTGT
jgi:nucleoside-diphosphate-sugar epimerase